MDFYETQLRAREVMDSTGLTLKQINDLPLSEFGRLMHGASPAEAA